MKLLPGQYYDEETNLHYNHFRYYDPTIGRYITSDPIGLIPSSMPQYIKDIIGVDIPYNVNPDEPLNHLYAYVNNNPLMYFDIKGLARKTILNVKRKTREPTSRGDRITRELIKLTADVGGGCELKDTKEDDYTGYKSDPVTGNILISYSVTYRFFKYGQKAGECECKITDYQMERRLSSNF